LAGNFPPHATVITKALQSPAEDHVNRRKRRLVLASGIAAVAVLAVAVCLLLPSSKINRRNYKKIHEGMTLAEVEAVLGPPRNDTTGPVMAVVGDDEDHGPWNKEAFAALKAIDFQSRPVLVGEGVWASNSLLVRVRFGSDNRVISHESLDVVLMPGATFARIRHWLRL